ncbi:hypothetical protein PILCRDRAFT_15395 [Piloderma croceum F 1598]|uniref:Uncharacterized protein n=1 Tax=Piloderma croceum (strain F 1598) TaxID=765440 RepID=A0A0C3AHG5_PILCF|nr:hypothetical protein PILCRDRAFT_15395 [Piloderma croceum F 1598]
MPPNIQGPELQTMSYPDLQDSPRDFLNHLRSLNLDAAITAFLHKQTQPPLYGQLDMDKAHEWCDCMDALLGKLNHTMGLQLATQDVCTTLSQLCTCTIGNIETQLEMQKNSDEDAAKKLADEKMAEEKYVHQKADDGDEQDEDEGKEDEEAHSESAAEEPQGTLKKKLKGQVEDTWKRLAQIVHTAPCAACVKAKKKIVWVQSDKHATIAGRRKKSCSNGSHRHIHDPVVKVKPKSPGDSVPSKRKMYLATNAKPIRHIDSIDVFNSKGSSKRQKTASGV